MPLKNYSMFYSLRLLWKRLLGKFIAENKLCPGDGYAERASWCVANGNGGRKTGLLLISDKAEGFGKKRDYINLLHKRLSWPVREVNKPVCFETFPFLKAVP